MPNDNQESLTSHRSDQEKSKAFDITVVAHCNRQVSTPIKRGLWVQTAWVQILPHH